MAKVEIPQRFKRKRVKLALAGLVLALIGVKTGHTQLALEALDAAIADPAPANGE